MRDADDELLTELGEAVRDAADVPARFIDAGKAAFAWRTVDEELAMLAYDSATVGADAAVVTRADPAALRALTFVSSELTVEVEVTPDALLGQLVPPQAGEVELRTRTGESHTAAVDAVGWFVLRPVPAEMFRLHVRPASGPEVLTAWVTL